MKGMRKVTKGVALSLAAVLTVGSVPAMGVRAEAGTGTAITDSDFLKAVGKDLRNQSGAGDVVNLRGTNAGGYLLQEFWMTPTQATTNVRDEKTIYEVLTERFGEEKMMELVDVYQDAYWTEADFDRCAELGMNCIRLPFWWRNLVDEDGVFYGFAEDDTDEDVQGLSSDELDVVTASFVEEAISEADETEVSVSDNDLVESQEAREVEAVTEIVVEEQTEELPIWGEAEVTDPYAKAFERMDWFVQEAGKRGLYVVLDFHGAPGSQNGSDHSGVDGQDAKEAASEFFFGENAVANQELYYQIWKVVAERYKDNATVAGYDLLNEPFCTYRYSAKLDADELHELLWGIYDKAYDVIREVDPNHVVIMEAVWDPGDLPNPDDYEWENVMYEYHNYLYDDYDNAAGGQISNMETKLNSIANRNYNVPSYMGEFSFFNQPSAWDEGLELMNSYGINWTTWTYKTVESYGMWGLYHHPEEFNENKINLETASFDEIKAFYARMGEAEKNSKLTDVASKYFAAETVESQLSPIMAEVEEDTYYFVGNSTAKILTSNTEAGGLIAATDLKMNDTDHQKFELVRNEDKTVSLKSVVNDKYVSLGEDKVLYATADTIGDSEKFYLLKASATTVALQSVVSGKIACVDEDEAADNEIYNGLGIPVIVRSDSTGGWETFKIYNMKQQLLGETIKYDYSGWHYFEAEDEEKVTRVGGGTTDDNKDNFSKGVAVSGLGTDVKAEDVASDWSNINYVKFDVEAQTAGTYKMVLRYNGDDDKAILVKVNDAEAQEVSIPQVSQDANWAVMHEKYVEIDLLEGTNTVYISGTIGGKGWMNLDRIDISKQPVTEKELDDKTYERYEAEMFYATGSKEEGDFFSNGITVGGMNSGTAFGDIADTWSNVKYVDFTLYAQKTGKYQVILHYNGDGSNGMKAAYRVNKGENQELTLNNAGNAWNTMNTVAFTVELQEGFNDLMISGTIAKQSNWANIDCIDVRMMEDGEEEGQLPDDLPKTFSGWTRFEAEYAKAHGVEAWNASVEEQDFFSYGKAIGKLSNGEMTVEDVEDDLSNVNYVAFTVEAEKAGDYLLLLGYNGDDDKVAIIKVNNGENQAIEVPNVEEGHDWNIPHEKLLTVSLEAGKNIIAITGAIGEGWMNLDYIDVCNAPININDTEKGTQRLEAENFEHTGNFGNHDNYSNGYAVGGTNTNTAFDEIEDDWSNVKYVDFTVYVEETGTYQIVMGYDGDNRKSMPVAYRVNDGENQKLALDAAGWSNVQTTEFMVELEKGFNDLKISGTIESTDNWINLDYIDVTLVPEEEKHISVTEIFEDIKETDWWLDAVQYVYDNGIMAGKGDVFRPTGKITREEFVQVLYNNSDTPDITGEAKLFPDVKQGEWYENAVKWANVNKIASGTGNGTFGVGKNITRQDIAVMLYKYAQFNGYDLTATDGLTEQFKDGAKVSAYAQEALNWAVTQGIINGKGAAGAERSETRLDQVGSATRAECASMIMKLLESNNN
ncbi:MAG: cellulase family glycosylhydrolase [Lachnospiraceae bacterium]|nr:cellulase family glycosylhydrolase [Lachnospiraceae bacterium]